MKIIITILILVVAVYGIYWFVSDSNKKNDFFSAKAEFYCWQMQNRMAPEYIIEDISSQAERAEAMDVYRAKWNEIARKYGFESSGDMTDYSSKIGGTIDEFSQKIVEKIQETCGLIYEPVFP